MSFLIKQFKVFVMKHSRVANCIYILISLLAYSIMAACDKEDDSPLPDKFQLAAWMRDSLRTGCEHEPSPYVDYVLSMEVNGQRICAPSASITGFTSTMKRFTSVHTTGPSVEVGAGGQVDAGYWGLWFTFDKFRSDSDGVALRDKESERYRPSYTLQTAVVPDSMAFPTAIRYFFDRDTIAFPNYTVLPDSLRDSNKRRQEFHFGASCLRCFPKRYDGLYQFERRDNTTNHSAFSPSRCNDRIPYMIVDRYEETRIDNSVVAEVELSFEFPICYRDPIEQTSLPLGEITDGHMRLRFFWTE